MPSGTPHDPIYVTEKNYGFWWFIGFILKWIFTVAAWVIVGTVLILIFLVSLLFRRKGYGPHDTKPLPRLLPRNPRMFYSDRR